MRESVTCGRGPSRVAALWRSWCTKRNRPLPACLASWMRAAGRRRIGTPWRPGARWATRSSRTNGARSSAAWAGRRFATLIELEGRRVAVVFIQERPILRRAAGPLRLLHPLRAPRPDPPGGDAGGRRGRPGASRLHRARPTQPRPHHRPDLARGRRSRGHAGRVGVPPGGARGPGVAHRDGDSAPGRRGRAACAPRRLDGHATSTRPAGPA